MKNWIKFPFFFLILNILIACSKVNQGTLYKMPLNEKIEKIAVLPFENFSGEATAGERMRRLTVQELVKRGYDVVEPGEINKVLIDLKVENLSLIGEREIKKFFEMTGIKYVIKGTVFTFEIQRFTEVSYPSVAVQINLVDAQQAKILRSTFRTEGGPSFKVMYFGVEPEPLNEVAKRVIESALIDILVNF
ncbi:MAG: CsgG/HfaB family protein [Candidatus Omnitrophica bacterium]|nr:CsgG/HfaB family protein [Candidatus Omnitrophota bacterium]